MSSGTIVFAPANENQARIYLAIARGLNPTGNTVRFLTFDSIYNQGAERVLLGEGVSPVRLSATINGEWCDYSNEEREVFLCTLLPSIARTILDLDPAIIVVSNDTGDIEQALIRLGELRGIRSMCVQDGLIEPPRVRTSDSDPRPPILCGGAHTICVWSESLRQKLIALGVTSRIRVTGNPLYDGITSEGYRPPGPPWRVLIAHQCFGRFGALSTFDEVAVYERLVHHILSRSDTVIAFKLHPQSILFTRYEELEQRYPGRFQVLRQGNAFHELARSHALVTISSTVAVEATILGIPAARLNALIEDSEASVETEVKFLSELHDADFPESLATGVDRENALAGVWHRTLDHRATERVCSHLTTLLQATHDSKFALYESSATLIVRLTENAISSAAVTALSQLNLSVDVLAIDCTPNAGASTKLKALFPSAPIRVISGTTDAGADLNQAITLAKTQVIIRAEPNICFMPNGLRHLVEKVAEFPEAACVTGNFALRNSAGSPAALIQIKDRAPLEELRADPRSALFHEMYAFDASQYPETRWRTTNDNPDRNFIADRYRQAGERSLLSVPRTLFFSSWAPPPMLSETESSSTNAPIRAQVLEGHTICVLVASPSSQKKAHEVLSALSLVSLPSGSPKVQWVIPQLPEHDWLANEITRCATQVDITRIVVPSKNLFLHKALETLNSSLVAFLGPDMIPSPLWLKSLFAQATGLDLRCSMLVGNSSFPEPQASSILSASLRERPLLSSFSRITESDEPLLSWLPGMNHMLSRDLLRACQYPERCEIEDLTLGASLARQISCTKFCPDASAVWQSNLSLDFLLARERALTAQFRELPRSLWTPTLLNDLFGMSELSAEVLADIVRVAPSIQEQLHTICSALAGLEYVQESKSQSDSSAKSALLIHEVSGALSLLTQQTRVLELSRLNLAL